MATYRATVSLGNTIGTTNRTATLTPAVGDLWLVLCSVSNNANDTPTCSDNNSGTYDLIAVGNFVALSLNCRMAAFVRKQLHVNTTSTQVTVATGTNDSGVVGILAISGMTRVGLSAILQSAQENARTFGTAPNPVFAANAQTGNLTVIAVGNGGNPAGMAAAPTGWTERFDDGAGTPACGLEACTRNSGFTGTSASWSSTSATQYASMFLELDNSAPSVTLTATPGAYTITGTSTPLLVGRRITATAGAYTITGTATPLLLGRRLTATPGSYSITGTSATLLRARTLTAQAGSYTVTGTAAMLRRGRTLAATAGTYAVAGTPSSLLLGRRLAANGGAYSVSGTSATLTYTPASAAFVLTAQPGAYAISGTAATLSTQRRLVLSAGAYAISGTLAALRTQRQLVPTPGAYAVAGTLATLQAQRRLAVTPGAYAITGTAAALTYTPAGVTLTLTALPGSYAIAGTQAGLRIGHRLIPSAGAYAIAGTAAGLRRGRLLQAAPGTYAIAGTAVALRRAARVVATAGVYTIVGSPVTFLTIPLGQDFDEVLWSDFAMRQPWSGALAMRQPPGGMAVMRQPKGGTLTMRQPSAGSVALLEED